MIEGSVHRTNGYGSGRPQKYTSPTYPDPPQCSGLIGKILLPEKRFRRETEVKNAQAPIFFFVFTNVYCCRSTIIAVFLFCMNVGCGSAQNYKITKLQSLMFQVHHHCCVPVLHERGGGQPSVGCGSAQNYKITKLQNYKITKSNVSGPPSLLCSCSAWTWWGATYQWLWLRSKLQNYKV